MIIRDASVIPCDIDELRFRADNYHVEIRRGDKLLFRRGHVSMDKLPKNWMDGKHKKIVHALDALEKAIMNAAGGEEEADSEMRYNTDPSFKGIDAIKKKQKEQLTLFQAWASEGQWAMFHDNHYDWWMFPIDEKGGRYGSDWTVYDGEIARLKEDADYIQNYLEGVRLLALSWGWDLAAQDYIANPEPEQSWHKWPVRLQKAAKSLKQFGFVDQFGSLKKYANELMNRGEDMTYNGRDLSKLFK